VDRFVKILPGGHEKKLIRVGAFQDGSNSVSGNLIAWAEYEPDLRWDNRNYSNLWVYDMKTGKVRHLTTKARYFAPNLSHDGTRIVAVRNSPGSESFLEILSTIDGKVLMSIKAEGSANFQSPDFTDNDRRIIFIYMNEKGKTIADLNLGTGKIKYHIPFTYTVIEALRI